MVDESEALDPVRVRKLLSAAVDALGGSERAGQVEMAEAVATAWTRAEHLLVQAGTGTGKSLAYLVPALLYADASEKPAVVATATLALQAQLVDRDLPLLAGAVEPELGRPFAWATLKGRSNYACLHRVREGVPDDQGELVPIAEVSSTAVGAEVVRARDWAEEQASAGGTGDRDRLDPGISDRAWAQVSVSARECLGAGKCPYGAECFAERARERASDVDIIVTNHALLAIDALEGVPVLPDHDVVVVDEGHELAARVTSIATADLSPGFVERAAKRSRSFVASDVFDELIEGGEILRRALVEVEPGRLDVLPDGLSAAVRAVRDAARTVQSGFATGAGTDREPDVEAGRRAAKAMVDEIFGTAERMTVHADGDVVWVEDQDRGQVRADCGSPRFRSRRCCATDCSGRRPSWRPLRRCNSVARSTRSRNPSGWPVTKRRRIAGSTWVRRSITEAGDSVRRPRPPAPRSRRSAAGGPGRPG